MTWGALISQTGQELFTICKDLNISPNIILSTQPIEKVCSQLRELINNRLINFQYIPIQQSKDSSLLFKRLKGCDLITLHGWLRIIPAELCDLLEIYNGHPGDIILHPELKGFNPQEKAFNMRLATSGSVVHKVTPEVDDGPVVHRIMTSIQNATLEEVYLRLRYTSLLAWKLFFTKRLPNLNNTKFAITGAHCTGKTTLVNAIQQIDTAGCYEYITSMTREAKQLGYKINEAGNDETQLYILNKHLERLAIAKPCVLDRSLIDGFTYTKILHEAGNISDDVMRYAKSLLSVEYMGRYNKIFYLPPTLQLVGDGLRSTEPEFRRHVISNFEYLVQCAGVFMPDLVTTIDGTVSERVNQVNRYLNII